MALGPGRLNFDQNHSLLGSSPDKKVSEECSESYFHLCCGGEWFGRPFAACGTVSADTARKVAAKRMHDGREQGECKTGIQTRD